MEGRERENNLLKVIAEYSEFFTTTIIELKCGMPGGLEE